MVSLGGLARKIFGSSNDRRIKSTRPRVEAINALETEMQRAVRRRAARPHRRVPRSSSPTARRSTTCWCRPSPRCARRPSRVLGMRPFDVQLIGGMVLHDGAIAEMRTGEGKTLVATLPVYLNALAGKGVHVVTVNDYLAKRDSEWMGRVYNFLGLTTGVIVHGLSDDERRAAYACDVTYGTNNELGFDYLRDNMKYERAQMVQRGHNYAIVDEVDSILVDEARTPLIISGPLEDRSELYNTIDAFILQLRPDDYEIDEKQRTAIFTEDGTEKLENLLRAAGQLKGESLYDVENVAIVHHVNNALKAHRLFQQRQGLHRPQRRDRHHRRVHRPHDAGPPLFGRPAPGAGSQGARGDPAGEPDARLDHLPELFPHVREARRHDRHGARPKPRNSATSTASKSPRSRPTCRSCASTRTTRSTGPSRRSTRRSSSEIKRAPAPRASRSWSAPPRSRSPSSWPSACARKGFKDFQVLNARYHEQEAYIVAQAGVPGAVTIATNMAGRGTDIQLGGNADMRIARRARRHAGRPGARRRRKRRSATTSSG